MYTFYGDNETAEFWFDDYDEWVNVKDQIENTVDAERLGLALCVDYTPEATEHQEFCGELIFPYRGHCCIFVLYVKDVDKVKSIVQSEYNEWKYISENDPNYAA